MIAMDVNCVGERTCSKPCTKKAPLGKWSVACCVSLLLLFALNTRVHANVLQDILDNLGYSATIYNSDTGYPISSAKAIVQTPDGFVWIGGYTGLLRYDGKAFIRVGKKEILSVTTMYVGSGNRLWLGTNDKGVALYEKGVFRFWGKKEGLGSNSVRRVTGDGLGNIFIACTNGLAYIGADLALHSIDDNRLSGKYIRDIDSDEKGSVAGITINGDFFHIKDLKVKKILDGGHLGLSKLRSINFDKHEPDVFYLGMMQPFIVRMQFGKGAKKVSHIPTGDFTNINKMYVADTGDIWLCTDDGIGYLDSRQKFKKIPFFDMDNSIEDMMVDYEGNAWFVSSRQGLLKIVENRFNSISSKAKLPKTVVNCVAKYNQGFYLGTDSGLYLVDSQFRQKTNKLTDLFKNIRIRCIKVDSSGNLWFGTFSNKALVKCDPEGNLTTFNKRTGLGTNMIRAVMETGSGDILVSGDGGVNVIRNNAVVKLYNDVHGMTNTSILCVNSDDNGVIYAGSNGGGLYIIDNDKITNLTEADGLTSGVIMRIKKDPVLPVHWLLTGNALAYLSGRTIHPITTFPHHNNFDIYFGEGDDIWVLSGNGIYVVNRRELYEDKIEKYKYYGIGNGMPTYVTPNSRSCLDEQGNLYVAGISGMFSLNIKSVKDETPQKIKLAIPNVEINGNLEYLGDNSMIQVPKNCRKLTINCYALSYGLNDQIVEYRLDGFDDSSAASTRKKMAPVTYTNLPGDNYNFNFLVREQDTGNINNEVSLNIVKEKRFVETTGFFVLVSFIIIVVILCSAIVYARIRTRILKQKHAESKLLIQQVIKAFSKAIDCKDHYTIGHSVRVAEYAVLLAKRMGLPKREIERCYDIALLHDIGKVAVPDRILGKAGRLTDEEFAQIKRHTGMGHEIMSNISMFPDLAIGAKFHHERVDGKGYPYGLEAGEIPLFAKIISVADTYDAMASTRVYRKGMDPAKIRRELEKARGTQLDAEAVNCFLQLIDEGEVERIQYIKQEEYQGDAPPVKPG